MKRCTMIAAATALVLGMGCGKQAEGSGTPPVNGEPAAAAPGEKPGEPAAEPGEKPAAPAAKPAEAAPAPNTEALKDPSKLTEEAPATFKAKFVTTKGDVVVEVHRDWAPKGADRFYNLVKNGFYTDIAFFRVIQTPRKFMAQFGIHGDPAIGAAWKEARIQDDPAKETNTRGRITFATAGPNTRTTQLFVNYTDNSNLDPMGFTPFGEIVSGMDVIDSLYSGYGEGAPRGRGPDQGRMQAEGNTYLKAEFPELDYLKSASIVQ